jgi:hypothetical protein
MANGVTRAIKRNVASHLIIASTVLTSGAIINVLQILLHILVKPVNKRLYHQLMYYVSWTWLARKLNFSFLVIFFLSHHRPDLIDYLLPTMFCSIFRVCLHRRLVV